MLRARGGPGRVVQRFGCGAWMTFVASDAALQRGTAAFRPIVPVADHNWASQKAESTAEEC
ncbi:hypothetical protein SY2F82_13580 [Streptomyces sp. Y2F8-2]|nr:hypothetical protein SY2F82_13580 [Streptomyces sp. Y2F8-2]